VVVREEVVRVGEVAVEGTRERVRVDEAQDSERGLAWGWGWGCGSGDGGAVEWASALALASSSVLEKGKLGKTFERRVAQRFGRRVLNLRSASKFRQGKKITIHTRVQRCPLRIFVSNLYRPFWISDFLFVVFLHSGWIWVCRERRPAARSTAYPYRILDNLPLWDPGPPPSQFQGVSSSFSFPEGGSEVE
jgi:hypothetical protein